MHFSKLLFNTQEHLAIRKIREVAVLEQVNFIKNPQDIIFKKNVNQPSIHSGGMKLILNPYFVICDMFLKQENDDFRTF